MLGQQLLVGQSGTGIFRRETRNRQRGIDRGLDCLAAKIRGGGVAAALAEIDADADALVLVELDGLDRLFARRHRLAEALRDVGLASGGAKPAGVVEHLLRESGQIFAPVTELLF